MNAKPTDNEKPAEQKSEEKQADDDMNKPEVEAKSAAASSGAEKMPASARPSELEKRTDTEVMQQDGIAAEKGSRAKRDHLHNKQACCVLF